MICSSRKEKLGSNTPINFITSSRFNPDAGSVATSEDFADSALDYNAKVKGIFFRLQLVTKEGTLNNRKIIVICCSAMYLHLLLLQLFVNQLEGMASVGHDL